MFILIIVDENMLKKFFNDFVCCFHDCIIVVRMLKIIMFLHIIFA